MEKRNKSDGTVSLTQRVQPEFKELVQEFADKTHRSAAQVVTYLIETHPEFVEFRKNKNIVEVGINA